MRKVHVKVVVDLFINANEDVDINEVIDEMDYDFESNTEGADIVDTDIIDREITDLR